MEKKHITALGDSVTKGVILTENGKYSVLENNYIDILKRELEVTIENHSKFGCTVEYGEHMVKMHNDSISYSDYTFIEYGGNDCDFDWGKIANNPEGEYYAKTPLEIFKEKMIELVKKIINLGSKPILITLPPIDSSRYFEFFTRLMNEQQKENVRNWLGGDINIIGRWHESYNQSLYEVSKQTNTPIIDITKPFETHEHGLTDLLCKDGIHPNQKGHKLIAATIINGYL